MGDEQPRAKPMDEHGRDITHRRKGDASHP